MLLDTVVEVPLDGATIGVPSFRQTPARSTKGGNLQLQSVDGLLRLLAGANVRHRPPLLEPSVLARRNLRRSGDDDACRGRR